MAPMRLSFHAHICKSPIKAFLLQMRSRYSALISSAYATASSNVSAWPAVQAVS